VAPKPVPIIVTCVPGAPFVGTTVETAAGITKAFPRLGIPFTVTTISPLVVPAGTPTVILLALQNDATLAAIPLNVTVLALGLRQSRSHKGSSRRGWQS
jgi:hypothetical protein